MREKADKSTNIYVCKTEWKYFVFPENIDLHSGKSIFRQDSQRKMFFFPNRIQKLHKIVFKEK